MQFFSNDNGMAPGMAVSVYWLVLVQTHISKELLDGLPSDIHGPQRMEPTDSDDQ